MSADDVRVEELREDFIAQAATQAGLALTSTRRYYINNPVRGEFLVGFAHQEEEDIRASVQKFADLIKRELDSRL